MTMRRMMYSPYEMMQTLIGTKEIAGAKDNPLIMAMLTADQQWPTGDEVPWCSAAMNFVCKLFKGVPRTKNLRARSWLTVGEAIPLEQAAPGFDVVILKRAGDNSPASVIDAPGHVGFYAGRDNTHVEVLGGNQGDSISIARFPIANILGIRRLI